MKTGPRVGSAGRLVSVMWHMSNSPQWLVVASGAMKPLFSSMKLGHVFLVDGFVLCRGLHLGMVHSPINFAQLFAQKVPQLLSVTYCDVLSHFRKFAASLEAGR